MARWDQDSDEASSWRASEAPLQDRVAVPDQNGPRLEVGQPADRPGRGRLVLGELRVGAGQPVGVGQGVTRDEDARRRCRTPPCARRCAPGSRRCADRTRRRRPPAAAAGAVRPPRRGPPRRRSRRARSARSSTSPTLPAWSGCLWVSTTWRTPAHPGPAESSTLPIASALPATPVSTTAAWPPRTRTYAATKPRSTRDQRSPAPPPLAEASSSSPPRRSAGPPASLPPQPATPSTATARAPRPDQVRKVRRPTGRREAVPMDRRSGRVRRTSRHDLVSGWGVAGLDTTVPWYPGRFPTGISLGKTADRLGK